MTDKDGSKYEKDWWEDPFQERIDDTVEDPIPEVDRDGNIKKKPREDRLESLL